MAITRAQIPEQIDVFGNGGGAESDSVDTGLSDLEKEIQFLEANRNKFSPDFQKSYQSYMDMLSPLSGQQASPNIFDLATSLSKGLTVQATSGQAPSIGVGLTMGFNSFSDYAKARRQAQLERMEKIRMQAASMAIDDVREGDKLYNSLITQRLLKDPSKLGKVVQYNKYDENGVVIATDTAYEKDKPAIDALLSDGYKRVEEKNGNVFNIGDQGPQKVENSFITDSHNLVKGTEEKAALSSDNDANLDKFEYLQNQIPDEGFGATADIVGGLQEYLQDVPVVGQYIDQKSISARQALKNTQIGFVLGIVGPYKGAISNKELSIFQASVAGLSNEKQANQFIIVTSRRANEIAREKAIAEREEYTKHYNEWTKGKINASEVTSRMNKWRANWANSEEAKIFTPEVLSQLGFESVDDLPQNQTQSREFYKKDLIKRGASEEEAERLTREMFTNINDFTNFYNSYQDDYNSKLLGEDLIIVP